jgi:hypothetical protein
MKVIWRALAWFARMTKNHELWWFFWLAVALFAAGIFVGVSADAAERSAAARSAFMHAHPCPANGHTKGACPGYIVDHIKPLACGGADRPSNMQWQTVAQGKAKDKWERKGCQKH